MEQWSVFFDIEGFGALWERDDQSLWSLGDLMEAIYLVGSKCYPESPDRYFAYQLGDGFIVVSDFGSASLDAPVAVAISVMRHVTAGSRLVRAAIAEGALSDIESCYPQQVLKARVGSCQVAMGGSVMTLFPVMGTALIRAVGIAKRGPRGPLLLIRDADKGRVTLPDGMVAIPGTDLVSVDWVHSEPPLVSNLQKAAGLRTPTPEQLATKFHKYCRDTNPPTEWVGNAMRFLSIPRRDKDA